MIDAKGKRVARKDTTPAVPQHILESNLTPAQRKLYERANDATPTVPGERPAKRASRAKSAPKKRSRSRAGSRAGGRAKAPVTATSAASAHEAKE